MISNLALFIFSLFIVGVAEAQQTLPIPDPNTGATSQPAAPPAQGQLQGVEELLDGSGLVINKNVFTYDGNEGRDPFKVYREYVQPINTPGTGNTNPGSGDIQLGNGKNIRTILVPEDIVVQGIMYRKKDPVALVLIKGVKGLNKLKINSPVGRNEGKVIDIQPDKIVIEQVKDFDGQKFTEKVVLEVRAKKN
ncbi:MAG: hypothetical protein B7Y39_09660 [Bdellovibrio sp. 28-41-41]|nr:MAG: hypothetical protein B7Y39_09660 [Bdellovibrio sp. 28-41-41]